MSGEQLELGAAAPTKRGGARKGAGRPKGSGAGASERVIFRLTPAQLATLTAAARPGESAGEAARRLLLELLEQRGTLGDDAEGQR
jgi:hypothetical protein